MRLFLAAACLAIFAAGCNCAYMGPCASVDKEGWTSFFADWKRHHKCEDCNCPYGGCSSGSRYSGPPANARSLYRYTDEAPALEAIPSPPPVDAGSAADDVVPPPPTMAGRQA